MNREIHVRFSEGLGVRLPWATRPSGLAQCPQAFGNHARCEGAQPPCRLSDLPGWRGTPPTGGLVDQLARAGSLNAPRVTIYASDEVVKLDAATLADLKLSAEFGWFELAFKVQAKVQPVSTLCAVCDQIIELHPLTHPFTPSAGGAARLLTLIDRTVGSVEMEIGDRQNF
jgi:hypothetical protein